MLPTIWRWLSGYFEEDWSYSETITIRSLLHAYGVIKVLGDIVRHQHTNEAGPGAMSEVPC